MQVRVLFFGVLKELGGGGETAIQLADGASLGDALRECIRLIPALDKFSKSIAISRNQDYAKADAILSDGDEIALLPPVSGGSSPSRALLIREVIDSPAILTGLKQPADGALVVFEGVVRDHTKNRKTLFLNYEAYEDMAAKLMDRLIADARAKFPVRDIVLVHRLGRLEVGEISVLIAVASAHRAAAFDACRWVIDTLKRTVPIWKKEHFADGAVWSDGEPFPDNIASGSYDEKAASK
jgi:molybdopterin synthase catalytic subunit/molybdopterin converting factor small subunit